jgi:uncharacterized protein (TIGR02679 family)
VSAPVLDPALRRALLAARDKREQRGASGDGTIVLRDLEPEEALALDGLLWLSRQKPILPGKTVRITLSRFEQVLRDCEIEPRDEYERVGERPLRDLPAERAARQELRAGFLAELAEHEVVRSRPRVGAWLADAARQGRIHAGMQPLVEQALWIVAALPAPQPIQRTVLAARMLNGDPHGLDVGTPLHGLTVSLLRVAAGVNRDVPAREVWAVWNVLVDPVSSNAVALNLPLRGESSVAEQFSVLGGAHVVLTYGQLSVSELQWSPGSPCFSCENPSVLIAAEQALGRSCPPLVCTSGHPSDAVRLLLSAAHRAGARIQHHGDFDDAGVQILRDLEDRYDVVPWRFDVDSLYEALSRLGHVPSDPRPTTLEDAVRRLPTSLPEELVIDELVADLRANSRS